MGVPRALMRARLNSLGQLQTPTPKLQLPALQLLPARDRLVTRRATARFSHACLRLQHVTINGPHFLLQSRPRACAQAIQHFIDELADT